MSTSGPGVDTYEMVLIHRVIRREFGQLPQLFRSAANDRARSKVIGAHAREMLRFLHTHHVSIVRDTVGSEAQPLTGTVAPVSAASSAACPCST